MFVALRMALLLFTLGVGLTAPAQARADDPWIHISVVEREAGGSSVEINLPLSMIDTALSMIPDSALTSGHLQLDANGVSLDDIRKLWSQLRSAGDGEFVKATQPGSQLTLTRVGDLLKLRVDATSPHTETIHLQVPVALVDALFAGTGNRIDLQGAAKNLATTRGDVLVVDNEDSHVRIWIDERSSGDR
jgi:hypothetical protein